MSVSNRRNTGRNEINLSNVNGYLHLIIKVAVTATMVKAIIMNKRSIIDKEYREVDLTAIAFCLLKSWLL
ncbi:MAG: hypothetical protein ACJ0OL_00610 [Dehalococcoidia bacterium]